ncbi:MAG: hypothetical protein ACXWUD_09460 [Methylosarcina sp.]
MLGDYGRENAEKGLRQSGLIKLKPLKDFPPSVFVDAFGVFQGLVKLAFGKFSHGVVLSIILILKVYFIKVVGVQAWV